MERSVAHTISSLLTAIDNCQESRNTEWEGKHRQSIEAIIKDGPSGSGWDNGTKLDWDASTPEKLVFYGGFHHMNDGGCYDGWTEHRIIVTPSLSGLNIKITGRNRNDIKEYIGELFHIWLSDIVIV